MSLIPHTLDGDMGTLYIILMTHVFYCEVLTHGDEDNVASLVSVSQNLLIGCELATFVPFFGWESDFGD